LAQLEHSLHERVTNELSKINFIDLTKQSSYQHHANTTTTNMMQEHGGMSIFEALAASGLRSLRYWREVPGIRSIVINDLDPVAIDMARQNVVRNNLGDDLVKNERELMRDGKKGHEMEEKEGRSLWWRRPRGIQLCTSRGCDT